MVDIRPLQRHEEFEACVDLQKQVWGFSDRDALPARTLLVAQRFGGCVLGAYEQGNLVGLVLSLPSFYMDMFAHHSHMLAVSPDYQNQGIGWRLKLAQRREALRRGIKLITWTFDPLESRNAHLNLNKLGIIIRTYYENFYPPSSSELHSGLGTDRFVGEWWIASKRVGALLDPRDSEGTVSEPASAGRAGWADPAALFHLSGINAVSYSPDGLAVSSAPDLGLSEERLILEIPSEIQKIRSLRMDLAKEWREKTRAALSHYLGRGYIVTKLLVKKGPNPPFERRTFYLLEKTDWQSLLDKF